jgi:peroxiredoxin family protein
MSASDPPSRTKVFFTYYSLLNDLEDLEKKKVEHIREINAMESAYPFLQKPPNFLSGISLPKLPNPPEPIRKDLSSSGEQKVGELSKSQKRKMKEKEKMKKKLEAEKNQTEEEKKKDKEMEIAVEKVHRDLMKEMFGSSEEEMDDEERAEVEELLEELKTKIEELSMEEDLRERERKIQFAGSEMITRALKKRKRLGKEGGIAPPERKQLQHKDGEHVENLSGNPEKID